MAMDPQTLREPISKQIFLLITVFLLFMASIFIGYGWMHSQLSHIDGLQQNEQAKIEISYLIHIDLQKIQSLFQNMSLCRTTEELDFISSQIITIVERIQELITVIANGGSTIYAYKVNFGNEEEIKRSFNYHNYNKNGVNLDIFELTSKVDDLRKHERSFAELVSRRINVEHIEDLGEIERKIQFFYKGVDPYFQRIFENSYRVYFTAQEEMQRLRAMAGATEQKSRTRFYILLTVAALVTSSLTGLVLSNISRLLQERNAVQQKLKESNTKLEESNANLEQTVHDRTRKLILEVDERQRAEAKAKRQAEFLKTVINSLDYPFFVVDINSYEILMKNDAAARMGPEHSLHCHALTHRRQTPCDGADHLCPVREVTRTGQPVTLEHVHYDNNGTKTFVEVHGYPILNEQGQISHMIEYCLDITSKKLAEMSMEETHKNLEVIVHERTISLEEEIGQRQAFQMQLEASEHYYRTLIESSNDMITIVNKQGIISYISPAVSGILGYTPEQVEGTSLYDYMHPDDVRFGTDKFAAFIASLQKDQRLEHRIRAADGQYRVLESSFRNLFSDGGINGLLLTGRDITAKREAESLMRKLQLVIEQSPSSVVITDKNGHIEYVNPQFEQVTGYQRDEVIGKNPRILSSGLTSAESFHAMWETIGQDKVWHGEFANKKKNGEIYYENVVVAPLKDEYGTVTHYVALKENITELKKAREEAIASSSAKSQFLSRMSHELRTPLNAINGFSELLLNSKNHPLLPRQAEQVKKINTAGHHLLNLINEILDLSRIESGRLSLSLETMAPAEPLHDCLSLVESLALQNNVEIRVEDTVASLPLIRADLTRFKQIVLNLLSNAIKYNQPGGRVTVSGAVEGNEVIIRVADTGMGIPLEKLKELFVPFARLGQDKTTIEGTGIGLTITKQLVELMNGRMDFSSTPGRGSTFSIALPRAASETPTPAGKAARDRQAECPSATLLYIENNPLNITLMREIVTAWPQFSLVVRKSGEKGLQAVTMLKPDIVLMDLHLPDMDGREAFARLRRDLRTEKIPVIALSADALPETVEQCRTQGFYDYLTKPVNALVLQSVITRALKEWKS